MDHAYVVYSTSVILMKQMVSTIKSISVITVFLFFGCEGMTLQWNDEISHRWAFLRAKQGQDGLIQLSSKNTGVTFQNDITRELIAANRALLNGSGVTTGDVDGDGLIDIYFCRTEGSNVLYRNLGGWKFEDITDKAGVACKDQFSTGTVLSDIDGDNDLDLLVTALGGPNAVFLNDGSGQFHEVTKEAGLAGNSGATTMALADVDGDGDLDIYMANYKTILAKDIYTPFELSYDEIVSEEMAATKSGRSSSITIPSKFVGTRSYGSKWQRRMHSI